MSPTVLDRAPPRPAKIRPPAPPTPPVPRRPREPRWILPAGLVVSIALHVLAFLVFRFSVTVQYGPPPVPRAVPVPEGTRIVQIVPVPDALAPAPAVPTAEPIVPQPARAEEAVPVTTPIPDARAAEVGSIADRIRPGETDPLLWTKPPEPLPPVPDDATLVRDRLYARLGVWNDSMLVAAEEAARATDWTTTDANGNKWGVSPGKLHLGSLTLPLPINFGPPPGRRDEIRDRLRAWQDIQDQAGRVDVKNNFNDRVRAIRERNQARRDTTKSGGG